MPQEYQQHTPKTLVQRTGFLIVFEGIDGTGKSTQAKWLIDFLENEGLKTSFSFEPSNGPHGQKIRQAAKEHREFSPTEELEIFLADRADHVKSTISPALARGEVVILDRYYFSTMAYQGARGFSPEEIRQKNEAFAPKPDLVFLMDLPSDLALKRIGGRGEGTTLFEKESNLNRCREIFLGLNDPFIVKIDAQAVPEKLALEIQAHALGKLRAAGMLKGND